MIFMEDLKADTISSDDDVPLSTTMTVHAWPRAWSTSAASSLCSSCGLSKVQIKMQVLGMALGLVHQARHF